MTWEEMYKEALQKEEELYAKIAPYEDNLDIEYDPIPKSWQSLESN
ncbi:MAG: hypothetical protein ACOX4I_00355 [Anaerovoracaceae bacterium]|jgi:hypothetical protein